MKAKAFNSLMVICITLLSGCVTPIEHQFEFVIDHNAQEISGRILEKHEETDSEGNALFSYVVTAENGQIFKVASQWPYFQVRQCVKLIISKLHPARLTNSHKCFPLKREINNVYVTGEKSPPAKTFAPSYADSRSAGAQKGASTGTKGAAGGLMQFALEEPMAIIVLPVIVPIAIIGGAVGGGAYGAAKAVPDEVTSSLEQALIEIARENDIQSILHGRFLESANKYSSVNAKKKGIFPVVFKNLEGFVLIENDAVLEIHGVEIGFVGGEGEDPSTAFFINIAIKLTKQNSTQALLSENFHYSGKQKLFSVWKSGNYLELEHELAIGCQSLSSRMAETITKYLYEYWVQ